MSFYVQSLHGSTESQKSRIVKVKSYFFIIERKRNKFKKKAAASNQLSQKFVPAIYNFIIYIILYGDSPFLLYIFEDSRLFCINVAERFYLIYNYNT